MAYKNEYVGVTQVVCVKKYTSDEVENDDFEKVEAALKVAIDEALSRFNLRLATVSTQIVPVDKYSICECDRCGRYLVNRNDNPQGLDFDVDGFAVANGGELDEEVLCEFCLPDHHRWG